MRFSSVIFKPIRSSRSVWVWLTPLLISGCASTWTPSPAPMAASSPARLERPACRPIPSTKRDVQLVSAEFVPVPSPALTAEQVRCQAVNSATLARLTEMERGLACELHQGTSCLTPNQKALEQELLWFRTRQQANKAAATAVEIFFRLAEAQQQAQNLTARRAEIESIQADVNELKANDLPVEQDPAELDRQRLSIQETQASLEAGRVKGWSQLQVLLGSTFPQEIPDMQVGGGIPPHPPEPTDAVHTAWQSHPELRSLQTMIQRLTPETLPVARAVLQQYEGGLGTVQASGFGAQAQQFLKVLCIFRPNRCPLPSQVREWEVRKVQLIELLDQREKAIAAEVETALVSWNTAIRQWQSANQRLDSWQMQLQNLKQKQPVDESVTAFDLAEARLGILEAKSNCIQFAFEARQAQVQLWTAQGVIGSGCGLPGEETCPGNPSQWLQNDIPTEASPSLDLPLPSQAASQRKVSIQSCRPLPRRN